MLTQNYLEPVVESRMTICHSLTLLSRGSICHPAIYSRDPLMRVSEANTIIIEE